jgi:glycosyltransferase involved in cell wall biosynthesis
MTIEHILGIFSPEHGGPTISIGNFVRGQAARGHKVKLHVLEGFPHTSSAVRLNSVVDQHVFPVAFPTVSGRSPKLETFLRDEQSPQIYHLHGTWLLAIKYGADEARKRKIPYIVEMMGSYQPHELVRKPWRKRLFRKWFADRMLHEASCIHTNSRMEMEQLIALGFRGPFAPIPVGFDTAAATEMERQLNGTAPEFATQWKTSRFILFLARIHPNKGVEVLIEAWTRLAKDFPDTRLVVAGPGHPDYKTELIAQSKSVTNWRIDFLNYVTELEKAWLYKNAFVYCLPSFGENFGATIQDALGFGTPVITTRRTPWWEIENQGVGWLAEPNASSVEDKLRQALSLGDADRALVTEKARKWIRKEFSLEEAINKQIRTYEWLCGSGQKPDFIISA